MEGWIGGASDDIEERRTAAEAKRDMPLYILLHMGSCGSGKLHRDGATDQAASF